MPPNTSMPGTTFITSAARLAVSLTWFLITMPRMPLALARLATSMSSMLRPNTSGCECTCMSITPAAGLTLGGGGGKPACANTWDATNAKLKQMGFFMGSSLGAKNHSRYSTRHGLRRFHAEKYIQRQSVPACRLGPSTHAAAHRAVVARNLAALGLRPW